MSQEGSAAAGNPSEQPASGAPEQQPAQQPASGGPSATQQLNQPGPETPSQPAGGQEPGSPGAPPQPAANAETWVDQQIQDTETRDWLKAKGYDKAGPEAVAKSYRELEKVFGADKADRTITLPGAEASEQERMEVFDRLGRPETPDKYEIPVPENGSAEFADWAKGAFHKAGLTTDQAKAVAENWNEYVAQMQDAQASREQETARQEDAELRKEWGRNYDKHISLAQRAARNLVGKDEQDRAQKLDAMERSLGYRGLMEFMTDLGKQLGEDAFVEGNAPTVHTAKTRIQELESNQEFMKRYTQGDPEAVETMRRLYSEVANG